tara:strand:+ start:203 stop:583 length:381 start_codon:yes stop_codon:yes gene_type:complete
MIYGIGVDIVDIKRFRNIIVRHGDKFAKRVLAKSEYSTYLKSKDKATNLAKCWAVKEAFVKAMGTGFTAVYNKNDIAYETFSNKRPRIKLSNIAEIEANKRNIMVNLSVSDELNNAVAFVILERNL